MIWKGLIFALAAYALYRLFMNDRKKKDQDKQQEKEELIATGDLVKDPECGTYVDSTSAISVRNGDTVYRFCSYQCRDTFLERLGHAPKQVDTAKD